MSSPILFLTGTATRAVKKDIVQLFGLEEILIVSKTPDRYLIYHYHSKLVCTL